ncbi:MAG TPA: hypothetical protein VEF07_00330 [Candidatus Binataceae bacterium]|nr:hypothetical protein [Candidatus Binataceae bacterium]
MAGPEKRLLLSIFACIFFGYAVLNCLVFYRRTRRQAENYEGRPFAAFVRSPHYDRTLWLAGTIGAVGFLVSSWQLVLSLLAIFRGH